MKCENCSSTENVREVELFGNNESDGEETLCWDCREDIIKARANQSGVDYDDEEPEGQVSLLDY